MIRLASTSAALAMIAGAAFSLELGSPVRCPEGVHCFIQQYPDRDPGPGYTDFTCGTLAYDGHKGTDIRVPSLSDLDRGVAVLAAAGGIVRSIRDGEPDDGVDGAVEGKECGNGVYLEHGGGWATQYCHLAKGSVAVEPGELIERGEFLGLVGYSGMTSFPHLEFNVFRDGEVMDPFDGNPSSTSCGASEPRPLWSSAAKEELVYTPGGLIDIGLSSSVPALDDIRAGVALDPARSEAEIILLWARYFGVREDDVLTLSLTGPNGETVVQSNAEMERNRAIELRYAGKRGGNWPAGRYQAPAALLRDGEIIARIDRGYDLR